MWPLRAPGAASCCVAMQQRSQLVMRRGAGTSPGCGSRAVWWGPRNCGSSWLQWQRHVREAAVRSKAIQRPVAAAGLCGGGCTAAAAGCCTGSVSGTLERPLCETRLQPCAIVQWLVAATGLSHSMVGAAQPWQQLAALLDTVSSGTLPA
jgi:hypothetical protein